MKRKIVFIFLAIVLWFGLAVTASAEPSDEQLVLDQAQLLRESERTSLNAILQRMSREYQVQIVIATADTLENADIDVFIEAMYDAYQLGYGAGRDGILLLVSMDPREYRILTNGSANNAIGLAEIDGIGDAMVSYLSDGAYDTAFRTFADRCEYHLDGYINGYPFDFVRNLGICLVIGIVIGLIVVFALKGQLKSVRMQNQADVYVKRGSMHVNVSNDIYLYRNVSRTKKSSSGNSSGSTGRGGSSRSVGGGSF